MRKYLTDYRNYIKEQLLKEDNDWEALAKEHLIKISFFQHERIVHLIVMVLFALMTLGTLIAFIFMQYDSAALFILTILFIGLLIPYIRHYYFLENQTQELYKDYDELLKKQGKL